MNTLKEEELVQVWSYLHPNVDYLKVNQVALSSELFTIRTTLNAAVALKILQPIKEPPESQRAESQRAESQEVLRILRRLDIYLDAEYKRLE